MNLFQIITIQGEYNDKLFNKKFLYLGDSFNLDEEVEKIKDKLNVRYREYFISSKIIRTDKENLLILIKNNEISKESILQIRTFFEHYPYKDNILPKNYKEIQSYKGLKYIQEVENRWDERGDGRPDIEYDEITYFKATIDIFTFLFDPK